MVVSCVLWLCAVSCVLRLWRCTVKKNVSGVGSGGSVCAACVCAVCCVGAVCSVLCAVCVVLLCRAVACGACRAQWRAGAVSRNLPSEAGFGVEIEVGLG